MRIAMLGTRGIPAQYGGFETAVEEIGVRLVERGHQVLVYSRNGRTNNRIRHYRGIEVCNLPAVRRSSLETLSHTALSTIHCLAVARPDVGFVFNTANSPYARLLESFGIPTATHIDGLEWQRSKWAGAGAMYFRWAEALAASSRSEIISDASAIAKYVMQRYARSSKVISYGAPLVEADSAQLGTVGLTQGGYHLVVARFEPENHVREIVEAYSSCRTLMKPLIIVGSAPYSSRYVQAVHAVAHNDTRVRFLGAVWDQSLLDALYAGALTYIHGHSVGGTNPSLLRAMGAAAPVVADDNEFNREVAGRWASYYSSASDLQEALAINECSPKPVKMHALDARIEILQRYNWRDVATQYEQLALELVSAHE